MRAASLLPKPLADQTVELVETYGDVAIERWQRDHTTTRSRRPHNPRLCLCLACSDGRAALGLTPLIPLFARRWMPEVPS